MASSQPVFKRTELEGFDVLLEKAEAISGCPFSQHLKEESLISLFPYSPSPSPPPENSAQLDAPLRLILSHSQVPLKDDPGRTDRFGQRILVFGG